MVVMDCDLQDPPEVIRRLYAKAREGHDVVIANRIASRQSWARRLAGWIYYRLIHIDAGSGSFSIVSAKARDAMLQLKDAHRDYRWLLEWIGYEQATIEFEHVERHAGESAYDLRRLLRFALEGIIFETAALLRWMIAFGFGIALAGLGLAAYNVVTYFTSDDVPAGWTSLAVITLLIGGFIIIALGVTGLYIEKTFEQTKGRPLYVVDVDVGAGELTDPLPEARAFEELAKP
jgi:dolichol-phosphate mannosyltransferase